MKYIIHNRFRVKVLKTQESFDKACDLGYGINVFGCRDNEMWLISEENENIKSFICRMNLDNFKLLGGVISDEEYFNSIPV